MKKSIEAHVTVTNVMGFLENPSADHLSIASWDTADCYNGAVSLGKQTITIEVADENELRQKALSNIELAREKQMKEHMERMKLLEDAEQSLLAIAYDADWEEV